MSDHFFSDYAMLRRTGGKRLVIALSGVNVAPGRFGYFQSFASGVYDSLLLNCVANSWYYQGIPLSQDISEGGVSLEATIDFLKRIAADYQEVVLLGGSMGAYGALLYGYYLPGSHVLAMGPELYTGMRHGHFQWHYKGESVPIGLSVLFVRRPDYKPYILVGEKIESDLYCLNELNSDRVLTIRNGHHNVAPMVQSIFGGFQNVVDQVLSGTLAVGLKNEIGAMGRFPDLATHLYLMKLGKIPLDRSIAFLHLLPKDSQIQGYLAIRIAALLIQKQDYLRALEFSSLARRVNPDDLEVHAIHDPLSLQVTGILPEPTFKAAVRPFDLATPYYSKYLDTC